MGTYLTLTGAGRGWSAAAPAGATYGYFGGGLSSVSVVTTDRITFSTGATAANTASDLSTKRYGLAGVSDKTTYGYFCGGHVPSYVKITDRITFSTGATAANTASDLSTERYYAAGLSDGSTYGYVAGGRRSVYLSSTDRITFSTGATAANTASDLSAGRGYTAGVSDGTSYGYVLGGLTGAAPYVATAEQITFSTGDFAASTVSNLSAVRYSAAGLSDGSTYGYIGGGATGAAPYLVITDRITFSTGATAANTASDLSLARVTPGSNSDGNTYGYWAGGNIASGAFGVTTDRITFSTGATAANTASDLSVARGSVVGLSDFAI